MGGSGGVVVVSFFFDMEIGSAGRCSNMLIGVYVARRFASPES